MGCLWIRSKRAEDEWRKLERLFNELLLQRSRCEAVDTWVRPELAVGFRMPNGASREQRSLAELSRTPWLRLVVDNVVQAMFLDGINSADGPVKELWGLWQVNGLDAAQISNHRAMVTYGCSFGIAEKAWRHGKESVRVRFLSPKRMAADFRDPVDPYPSVAVEWMGMNRVRMYTPGFVAEMAADESGAWHTLWEDETGLDFVPIVRFANLLDLEGRWIGEAEPFIPTAQRINKTTFDRLLAQHYSSWKVKTITGIELPSAEDEFGEKLDKVDQEAVEKLKKKLSHEDVLLAESPDAKFGVLDATDLAPFVEVWRSDIEALAAVSQTPAHALTGQLVNLSAEALAAARAPLTQKVHERRANAGAAYTHLFRAVAWMMGWEDIANDDMLRVSWQDLEVRSISQAADALGKLAQMLNIPKKFLWRMIPGLTPSEIVELERLAEEEIDMDPLAAVYRRHAESTVKEISGGENP